MPRGKKFTAEQIIGKLREAEVELARGKTVPEVVRKLGVTEPTYYRWKREYGGYADNTGVVSAMDAWRAILADVEAGADRPFDQIVLVRIDRFPKPQTSVAGTNEGFLQAVFGPVFSLLSARSATQLERADREIERCAEFARDRGIPLYSTLIRFGDHCPKGTNAKPPLSWALSARQEESIEDAGSMFTAAIDRHWALPGCGPGKENSLGALLGLNRLRTNSLLDLRDGVPGAQLP